MKGWLGQLAWQGAERDRKQAWKILQKSAEQQQCLTRSWDDQAALRRASLHNDVYVARGVVCERCHSTMRWLHCEDASRLGGCSCQSRLV